LSIEAFCISASNAKVNSPSSFSRGLINFSKVPEVDLIKKEAFFVIKSIID
jgi:hypothetical protein